MQRTCTEGSAATIACHTTIRGLYWAPIRPSHWAPIRPSPYDAAMAAAETLHQAVERGDLAAVTRLHADDVDLEARDGGGRTAMAIAAGRCHHAMVELLYALGADPGRPDATTFPLFEAAVATTPPLDDQLRTLELLSGWHGVDLDCEPEYIGTALEHLCARPPHPYHAERVGAVVRMLLLRGAVLYRGGLTCRPVRDELLRRMRQWIATQRGVETFLAGCHGGIQQDGGPSLVRALRNAPMVRRRIGQFVPVLSRVETRRLRHAVYAVEDSIRDEAWHAETHAFSHVTCFAM